MSLSNSTEGTNSHPSSFDKEGVPKSCKGRGVTKNEHVLKITTGHACTANFWQVGAVVSCFISNFFSGGIGASYGVLYTYMQEPLEVSEYQISWIASLSAGFHGFTSILATILIDSKGCRVTTLLGPVFAASGFIIGSQIGNIYLLYMLLGVLPGMGLCLSFNATMVHISRKFTRWRSFAVGFGVVGSAVGMLVLPPLTSGIADIMGWRGAVLIHGGLLLHQVPCALWMNQYTTSGESSVESSNREKASIIQSIINYLHMFRLRGTVLACLSYFFMGLGYHTFWIFIPPYVMTTTVETTATDAALIISLVGFGGLAGRILFAGASLAHKHAPQVILMAAFCLCGLSNIIVPLNQHWVGYLVNGVFYGLVVGAFATVSSVVMVNLFGLENLSRIFGTLTFVQGLGSFCGPPLQSYIAALTDNQQLVFYTAGGFYVISSLFLLSVVIRRKGVQKKTSANVVNVFGAQNDGFAMDCDERKL